jgi:hypothetical protein
MEGEECGGREEKSEGREMIDLRFGIGKEVRWRTEFTVSYNTYTAVSIVQYSTSATNLFPRTPKITISTVLLDLNENCL